VYVVRLSFELPYAVGVRKNTAHSITRHQRKQSKRQTTSGVLFESLVLEYFCTYQTLSYSSLPMLPHTGQSSQLVSEANDGDAQFLPNLVGAVVWHTRHKTFKRVLRQPIVDTPRNFFLTPTTEMLTFFQEFREVL